jgi:hypothetical protein
MKRQVVTDHWPFLLRTTPAGLNSVDDFYWRQITKRQYIFNRA